MFLDFIKNVWEILKTGYDFVLPYFDTALPLLFVTMVIILIVNRFDDVSVKKKRILSLVTFLIAAGVYSGALWNQTNLDKKEAIALVEQALVNITDAVVYNNEDNNQVEIFYAEDEKEILIVADANLSNLTATYEEETYELKIENEKLNYGFKVVEK